MSQIETMSKPEGPDGPRMYSEEIIVAPSKTNIEMANFETAVSATGFGKFNIFLLLVAIPSAMSPVFESSTMSYVLPVAQCDLNLTLQDKGILNAMGFGGMIASGLIWGYLCDTLGRKKLIMAGFLLDGFFILLSSTSQSFMFLMVVKFFGGFIINGPFAALSCYLSEFHCVKYRSRIQIARGIIISGGNVVLPLLAWSILPRDIHLNLLKKIEIHTWNIFLLICAFPAILSGLIFIVMPESPKFLMAVGQNKEALQIFKRVYRINTGKSEATFPIKELVDEIKLHQNEDHIHGGLVTANRTKTQALREGWQQLKPLFFPPLLPKLILVCFIQFLLMMTVNTIKIWLPQLFQAINDFQFKYENKSSSLCEMIEMLSPKHASIPCTVNFKNSSVYINSMIVSLVTIGGYLLAAVVINKVGRKKILHVAFLVSGSCAIAMYFSSKNVVILVLSCIFASIGSICSNVMQTITIDLFPTTLRSMTLSILMMAGRSGILIGNLLFPLLLSMGCGFVFFSSGGLLLGCAVLSIVLPNTERKSLQ